MQKNIIRWPRGGGVASSRVADGVAALFLAEAADGVYLCISLSRARATRGGRRGTQERRNALDAAIQLAARTLALEQL